MSNKDNAVILIKDIDKFNEDWIHLLLGDWQLLADLACADILLWRKNDQGDFICKAHARPSGAPTLFYRDFVSRKILSEWQKIVEKSYISKEIIYSQEQLWYDETLMKLGAVPIVPKYASKTADEAIAVITVHSNLSVGSRANSWQETAFIQSADNLFNMIAVGDFPSASAPTGPRRGAPRASDGLLRLDIDGVVTFASPNALSAFNRMGYYDDLEGESLAEITTNLISGARNVDESLPVVVTGRAPWRTDIEAFGVTISVRAIPTTENGDRTGALVLVRDVSELRTQEKELITKDATIREIHHRVKNNLQTVASLLRMQSRTVESTEAKEALANAMRRVSAIAFVHDTLSTGLSQDVDFDNVFERVLTLVAEVSSSHNTKVHPKKEGKFGDLPSDFATPLALALTELVANAVEHGLEGREGEVIIKAKRKKSFLKVTVFDNGVGIPSGSAGRGLGTKIVKTLIQEELNGVIEWKGERLKGTKVKIEIPFYF